MFKPLPHQQAAFDKFKDLPHCGLMWTMGRGKTKTAIDLACYKFQKGEIDRVLIVAPNYVHKQWVAEQLPLHCGVPYVAHAFSSSKTATYLSDLRSFLRGCGKGNDTGCLSFFAVHMDAFSHGGIDEHIVNFCKAKRTMFIVDEASRIKNPKAKRVVKLTAIHRTYGGPSLIMTGTALAKRPADVWSMCNFMDPKIIPVGYSAFEQRHTVMMNKKYTLNNGKLVTVQQPIDEFQWRLVKKKLHQLGMEGADPTDAIYIAATQYSMSPGDVKFIAEHDDFVRYRDIDKLKQGLSHCFSFLEPHDDVTLPPKVYRTMEFPLVKEQKDILKQLQKYAVATYGDSILSVQNKAALQTKALQVCGGFFSPIEDDMPTVKLECANAKLDYIMDSLEEIGDAQFLVFAAFTAEIRMLGEVIGKEVKTACVYGETKQSERDTLVEAFKRGEIQCLVCNPTVAGYGLNLQNALLQYWYSRNYITEARIQAEGRSHRIGITESPIYVDLVYDCKFEKEVLANNKDGKDLNDYFNNHAIDDLLAI